MFRPVLLAASLLLAAGPALAQTASDPHAAHAPATAAPAGASADYMSAMTRMQDAMHAEPMTGDAAADYARMMIPHHQSAIDMAEAYLGSGDGDPTLRRLSEDVVRSQEAEIATLREWLAAHPAR